MSQIDTNVKGRRRGARRFTCKRDALVNGHVPGTGIVRYTNSESTPAGFQNGTKPQHMVNGYINHWHRGKSSKAAPQRTLRRQGGAISAVTDVSTGVSSRDISDGVSVSGAASLDIVFGNCGQTVPGPSLSASAAAAAAAAAAKNQKRIKESKHTRDTDFTSVPPQKENWEHEVREVTLTGWENMCFGRSPYGPEDVLHFALRDLTLKHRDHVNLPLMASYRPTKCHLPPTKISWYYTPPEPGQFEDADE